MLHSKTHFFLISIIIHKYFLKILNFYLEMFMLRDSWEHTFSIKKKKNILSVMQIYLPCTCFKPVKNIFTPFKGADHLVMDLVVFSKISTENQGCRKKIARTLQNSIGFLIFTCIKRQTIFHPNQYTLLQLGCTTCIFILSCYFFHYDPNISLFTGPKELQMCRC